MTIPPKIIGTLNIVAAMVCVALFVHTSSNIRNEVDPVLRQLHLVKGLLVVVIIGQLQSNLKK